METLPIQAVDIIADIESGGNEFAMGDAGLAYGVLQIQQGCLTDVNRANGTDYKLKDLLGNRKLSEWVYQEYMKLYATEKRIGRPVTDIDRARIWNGGPNGWKKDATIPYAEKFKKISMVKGYFIA